jgi:molybdopterin converting factor small subunit
MTLHALDALIGLRLSIVRFYANVLGLHFGDAQPHARGGTVGTYALHVDCPWRIDGSDGTVVGNYDRWDHSAPQISPNEAGLSLRDQKLDELFGRLDGTGSWMIDSDRFLVVAVDLTIFGDVNIKLADGHKISLFPAASEAGAWRFFAPGDKSAHVVFPDDRVRE